MEYDDIYLSEEQSNVEMEETVEVIEVSNTETYEIDSDVAFPALGETNELLRHQLLNGRELLDQHPITAITGLRDELDSIESLQTVYSDKRNQANYYLWQDENPLQENRNGYFVSVCSDINEIEICTSANDIFGVTVDDAAFVGAQSDIARDIKYGLVVTSGVVHVRCEQSVSVGDYVVSNDYGYAQSNTNGYKVVGRHQIDGVEYAEITLVTPISRICKLSDDVEDISERMDSAETNIVAAINVANAAFNKASEVADASEGAIKNAIEALDKANDASEKTDGFESRLETANEVAVQAKAIAENAAVSAESIRNEAVSIANQALSDVSDAIEDLDVVIEEVNNSINDAESKAQLAIERLTKLQEDMQPLAEWKDDEGNHGFAGFVAEVDNNAAIIADLVKWQGKVEDGSVESISGLEKRVSDNEAELSAVASYKKENADGTTTDGFAGLIAQVDENESNLSTLASYSYTEDGKVISSGLAGLIQQVGANASSIKMLVGFEDESVDSLGEIAIKVNENESAIQSLATWQGEASKTIASTKQTAEENKASIVNLTSADTELTKSMTEIKQQSDENGASIELLASSIDKYSVGEYSQSYGLTHEQAVSILKDGMIYVPTKHGSTQTHSETFSDTEEVNEFTPGAYYIWNNGDWVEYGNSVAFFSEEPAPSRALKFWYIDSDSAPEGYEPHALYVYDKEQWKKVNILEGNVNNRATSMIKQMANKIAIDVADARGDIASHQQWIDNNGANIQSVVTWKSDVENDVSQIATIKQTASDAEASIAQVVESVGENGEVSAASIVTAINGQTGDSVIKLDASVVNITADDINLEGLVTIESLKGEGTTEINGSNITTGFIKSNNYDPGISGMQLDLENGTWDSANFTIDGNGSITATAGKIGKWVLRPIREGEDQYVMYAGGVGMSSTTWGSDPAFYANYTGAGDTPWDHNTNKPSSDTSNWQDNCAFYVSNNGNAKIKGHIEATTGKIGGWDVNGGVLSSTQNTNRLYLSSVEYDGTYWIRAYDTKTAKTYFGVDRNGLLYAVDATISGTITAGSVLSNGLYTGTNKYSYFTEWSTGRGTYWEATDDKGTIRSRIALIPGKQGSNSNVHISTSSDGFSDTNKEYGIQIFSNGVINVRGTSATGSPDISDKRKKHLIERLDGKYEVLFDNLTPVKYKYNDGTSDRYHTGFIAQEIEEALYTAGLTTQEFAGLTIQSPGTEDELYGLRYSEFIALNTSEIQKLKARTIELENKVAELEALIKGE